MKVAVLLALLFCSPCAMAEGSAYFKVTCDASSKSVQIEELSLSDDETPSSDLHSIRSLGALETIPTDIGPQDVFVQKRTFRRECTLGPARYLIEVAPWKWNPRFMGMCGAGNPSVRLTVWRSGRKLLNGLIFRGYCNPPESLFQILRVDLSEVSRSVTISLQDNNTEEAIPPRVIPYRDAPKLVREQLQSAELHDGA